METSSGKLGAWQANQSERPPGLQALPGGSGWVEPSPGEGLAGAETAQLMARMSGGSAPGWAGRGSGAAPGPAPPGSIPALGGDIPDPGAALWSRRDRPPSSARSPRPGSIPGLGRPVDPGAELGDPRAAREALPGPHRRPSGPRGSQGPPFSVGADTARRMPGPPGAPRAPRRSLRTCTYPGKALGTPVWVGCIPSAELGRAMGESRAQIILFWQVWDASLFVPGANSIPLLCPADGGQAALEREGEGCKGLAEQRCRTSTTAELRLARAQHTGHGAGQGGRMSRGDR